MSPVEALLFGYAAFCVLLLFTAAAALLAKFLEDRRTEKKVHEAFADVERWRREIGVGYRGPALRLVDKEAAASDETRPAA